MPQVSFIAPDTIPRFASLLVTLASAKIGGFMKTGAKVRVLWESIVGILPTFVHDTQNFADMVR